MIGTGGTLLNRPDGFVVWRTIVAADDPAAEPELEHVLRRVLSR